MPKSSRKPQNTDNKQIKTDPRPPGAGNDPVEDGEKVHGDAEKFHTPPPLAGPYSIP